MFGLATRLIRYGNKMILRRNIQEREREREREREGEGERERDCKAQLYRCLPYNIK